MRACPDSVASHTMLHLMRVMLLHHSEGAALLQRDLESAVFEVETAPIHRAEEALAQQDLDAVLLEASGNLEETKRLLESPSRPARVPLLLLLRVDQMTGIDPAWGVDDFIVMPAAPDELAVRLRRAVWRKTGLDA